LSYSLVVTLQLSKSVSGYRILQCKPSLNTKYYIRLEKSWVDQDLAGNARWKVKKSTMLFFHINTYGQEGRYACICV